MVTGSSESTVSTSLITEPGKIVGTPLYMAPELLTGKPAEKQSDLWSLAVITYEILTGHHPFIDLSAAGGEQMHREFIPVAHWLPEATDSLNRFFS